MNKLLTILALGLIAVTAVAFTTHLSNSTPLRAAAAGTDYCPNPVYRSDAWMTGFITKLKSFSFDNDMMEYLKTQIPTDSHMFSTEQILQIFSYIHFDSSQSLAVTLLNPYIVSLTGDNVIAILKTFSFSASKMDALKNIGSALIDVSEATKTAISNVFTFSSDISAAKAFLDTISPRNCIYGTVSEAVAAFVIDISGSMDQTFKANGVSISRLNYVKAQLTATLAQQLKPYQKFNIIAFSSSAAKWKSDYVDATTDNINAAITYINNLKTAGSTNISSGLDLAFSTTASLRGIYLLSDGVPNSGIQTVAGIQTYLNNKNAALTNKVHVNTVSFIMAGSESSSERTLSFQFLNAISDATGGSFKGLSSSS